MDRPHQTDKLTGSRLEQPDSVEGAFFSEATAEAVAKQLRTAFPDSVVTVEDGERLHRVRVRAKR